MVTVLPARESFGAALGKALGSAAKSAAEGYTESRKNKQLLELFNEIEGKDSQSQAKALQGNMPNPQEIQQKFLQSLPMFEQMKGSELTSQDADDIWKNMFEPQLKQGQQQQPSQQMQQEGQKQEQDPFMKAKKAILSGQPELAKTYTQEAASGIKQAASDKKLAFAETKDYRNHVSEQARSAQELEPVLDQMERLIKSGKLTNPVISKLADKFGLVGLLDPTSQQFNALSVGFLKDAKTIFGSRVTNFDLETYLDKIPRLAQTNAGKNALIDNFRTLGEAAKVKNKIKNQILKENQGIPPLDIEEQVNDRAVPELDKLADKFNRSFYESSKTASGKYLVRHPNGTLGEVPQDKLKEAMDKGYRLE